MDIMVLIISLGLPVAGGAFAVRWWLGRVPVSSAADTGNGASGVTPAAPSAPEALSFGLGLGLGLTSFWMFLLGLSGIPFSRLSVGMPVLVFALVFFFLMRRAAKGGPGQWPLSGAPLPWPALTGWRLAIFVLMALWVGIKTAFVFYESMTRPVFTFDNYINWAVSAKFFYYKAGLLLDPSNEHFFGRGYRLFIGHPLHLPLIETWLATALGRFHEVYVKIPSALYFTGILGVLYYSVRREAGPFYAMATVFFMATAPILTAHGMASYADLPLSFFALAGSSLLLRFLREDSRAALSLSGLFLGLAVFVKNEGLFFPLAGGLVLLLFLLLRRRRASAAPVLSSIAAFVLPMAFIIGPWLIFKAYYGIGFGHSGPASGLDWFGDPYYAGRVARGVHWEVIGKALSAIFLTANYNLVFPLWILAGILGRKTIMRGELKYLYLMILLVISMFAFVYLTLEVAAVTEQTGIHRNTLTYLPMVYLCAALALSSLWPCRKAAAAGQEPAPFDSAGPR